MAAKKGMFDEREIFSEVLEDTRIGLWRIQLDEGREPRMYADSTMLDLLGIQWIPTPEECYQSWYRRIEGPYYGIVDNLVKRMRNHEHAEVSYAWNHPVRGQIFVRCGGIREADYEGGASFHGYHQDISQTVMLAQERKQLKEYNNVILDSMKKLYFAVWTVDLETGRLRVLKAPNDLSAAALSDSMNVDEVFGKLNPRFHELDRERVLRDVSVKNLRRLWKEGNVQLIGEYQRLINGSYRWVAINVYFMKKEGTADMAMLAVQDIDERKKVEERNEELQSIYKFTVQNEYDCVAITDLTTNRCRMQPSIRFGGDGGFIEGEQEIIHKVFIDTFVRKEDRESVGRELDLQNILLHLSSGEKRFYTYFQGPEDMKCRHKEFAARFYNDEKTKLFSSVRDIERRVYVEEQSREALTEAFQTATRANQAKSDFLSKMSHDIRTPMNAIIGMTAIAERHLEDQEKVRECLGKIDVASEHLMNLINEVLDMSSIESGKMDLSLQEFSVFQLMSGIKSMMSQQAEERGQHFTVEIKNVEHERVIGDYGRLQKVCINIVSNAVKYTGPGGRIAVTLEEIPSLHSEYAGFCLCVKDNGIGMSKEFQAKLFEPFTRENTTGDRIEGTGLGLSIVKNIVQMMNGSIDVESEQGTGSVFSVKIYLKIAEDTSGESEPEEEIGYENIFHGEKILLVEDNELNVEIAEEILRTFGVCPVVAHDGREAVEKYQSGNVGTFSMILMDIQMPEMNGYEAAQMIRRSGRQDAQTIPIIAMTANAFAEDVSKAAEAGMNGHVAKPINLSRLAEEMKKWI